MPKPNAELNQRIRDLQATASRALESCRLAEAQLDSLNEMESNREERSRRVGRPGVNIAEQYGCVVYARDSEEQISEYYRDFFKPAETAAESLCRGVSDLVKLLPTDVSTEKICVRILELGIMKVRGNARLNGFANSRADLEALQWRLDELETLVPASKSKSWKHLVFPEGTTWSDVTIRVTSQHQIQIIKPHTTEPIHFAEAPFEDGRRKGHAVKCWSLFEDLAEARGQLSITRQTHGTDEARIGASALSKISPPLLSKIDPGHLM